VRWDTVDAADYTDKLRNNLRSAEGFRHLFDLGSRFRTDFTASLQELRVRHYFAGLPEEAVGWLAAAREPIIGKSLSSQQEEELVEVNFLETTRDLSASSSGNGED
jgi:hypothetical protein